MGIEMGTAGAGGPASRARDLGWGLFAGVATLLALSTVLGAVVAVFSRRWGLVALAAPQLLGLYWFAAGGWRRTSWGRAVEANAPPDPPALSTPRARLYIVLGVAAVVASGAALAFQLATAHR